MASLLMGVSLAALLAACCAWTRLAKPAGPVDAVLVFWLCLTAHVVLIGEALSGFDALARPFAWCAAGAAALCVSLVVATSSPGRRRSCLARPAPLPLARWRAGWRALPRLHRIFLGVLGVATIVTLALNLLCVLSVAPAGGDVLAYHLARVAYFLEHNNLDAYPANYWAQVAHPRNASILFLYTYLASGRRENLFALVQYLAYLVSTVAVYGVARRAGHRRSGSLFAALVFGLLTDALMEASTAQNDMLCAAYVGATIYFLLAYRERGGLRHLLFAGASAGLGLGVKASVLVAVPPIALVALYAISGGRPGARELLRRRLPALVASFALGVAAFAVPAGYVENYRRYDHLIGPPAVLRKHTFAGTRPADLLAYAGSNFWRFGFDFLSLDGLPPFPPVLAAQGALRWLPDRMLPLAGVNVVDHGDGKTPYDLHQKPVADEIHAYWGVLGFALVWPVVAATLAGLTRSRAGDGPSRTPSRVLAVAAFVFLVGQAFSGPYDHWRGRYFIMAAVMAAPLVAWCLERRRGLLPSAYLTLVVALGGVSGVTAVVFRLRRELVAVPALEGATRSVLARDRLGQMLHGIDMRRTLRHFEALVPPGAVVGVALPPDNPEYALFGEGLTRTIEPVDPARMNLPAGAQYFLFSARLLPPDDDDTPLGETWYLRDLTRGAGGR